MFTEERIEEIMENVKMNKRDFSYFPGYAQTYWEPAEPESIEISFILTYEGLTAEELENMQELKEEPYFLQYVNFYIQQVLEDKLYNEELTYWETHPHKDDIELTREGNTLSIDVYYYE